MSTNLGASILCVSRGPGEQVSNRSPALVKITCSVCLCYLCERKSQRVSIVLLPKMKKKKEKEQKIENRNPTVKIWYLNCRKCKEN